MALRLSVVVPTYNGERFVREQITSIVTQSRRPNELIVGDDGSHDDTVEAVREATRSVAERVLILTGGHRGLRRNLQQLLETCDGDVIVLADQDDVWLEGRLAAIERAFDDPAVTLWVSDASLVDESGAPTGQHLWQAVHLDDAAATALRDGKALRRLLHGQTITGATMAFRRSVLDAALPFPVAMDADPPPFRHDGWIAVFAALTGTVAVEPHPFTEYRQHTGQTAGLPSREPPTSAGAGRHYATAEQLAAEAQRVRLVADRLREHPNLEHVAASDRAAIDGLDALFAARVAPRGWKRPLRILEQWIRGGYRRHARGWRTAAADLMLPRR